MMLVKFAKTIHLSGCRFGALGENPLHFDAHCADFFFSSLCGRETGLTAQCGGGSLGALHDLCERVTQHLF